MSINLYDVRWCGGTKCTKSEGEGGPPHFWWADKDLMLCAGKKGSHALKDNLGWVDRWNAAHH